MFFANSKSHHIGNNLEHVWKTFFFGLVLKCLHYGVMLKYSNFEKNSRFSTKLKTHHIGDILEQVPKTFFFRTCSKTSPLWWDFKFAEKNEFFLKI